MPPGAMWCLRFGMIGVLVILAVVRGSAAIGRAARSHDPESLSASRLVFPLVFCRAGAAAAWRWKPRSLCLGPLVFVVILWCFRCLRNRGERHPLRRPWAMGVVLLIWVMIGTLWIEGKRAPWSPDFAAQPLQTQMIGATSGPVAEGGDLFHDKGCEFCHAIDGRGGHRGPDLTYVGDRLTPADMTIRIVNGAKLMPAFGGILTSQQLDISSPS